MAWYSGSIDSVCTIFEPDCAATVVVPPFKILNAVEFKQWLICSIASYNFYSR